MGEHLPGDLQTAVRLGGEMGQRFAALDWAMHPLGPPSAWAPGIRAMVATALTSQLPIVLWLGPEQFLVYNDPCVPVFGERHPDALGRPGAEVWGAIWDPIGPMPQNANAADVGTWSEGLLLPALVDGVHHERYFTCTYSPLLGAAGAVAGVFCALVETTERVLAERRVGILEKLDEDAASAIAAADVRLQEAEADHLVATQLQRRLLRLDVRSRVAVVGAVYHPAAGQYQVGGDWYGAVGLADGQRLGVCVGDVTGHGVEAAIMMSQLRSALETAALVAEEPGDVLDIVEEVAAQAPDALCTTLAYAVVDPGAARLTYACAGHPYPLLVQPDGTTTYLEEGRRPLLGTSWAALGAASQASVPFPAGSMLVLFTDGLIERRGESLDDGLARLASQAAVLVGAPVGEVCSRLASVLTPAQGFADDVAVVAVRPVGTSPSSFVEVLPASLEEVPGQRQRLRRWLGHAGVDAEVGSAVLLAVGEALSNAIEHGSVAEPVRNVTTEVFMHGAQISASVSDFGQWVDAETDEKRGAGRGRGLAIIQGLSDQVERVTDSFGTRVTMLFTAGRTADATGGAAP